MLKHVFSYKLEFEAFDQTHMKWKRSTAIFFNENNIIAKNIQNISHIYNIADIYTKFFHAFHLLREFESYKPFCEFESWWVPSLVFESYISW